MAYTELFTMNTVTFKWMILQKRLKLSVFFYRKTSFLLTQLITWINRWVWLVGIVVMAATIRSGFLLPCSSVLQYKLLASQCTTISSTLKIFLILINWPSILKRTSKNVPLPLTFGQQKFNIMYVHNC